MSKWHNLRRLDIIHRWIHDLYGSDGIPHMSNQPTSLCLAGSLLRVAFGLLGRADLHNLPWYGANSVNYTITRWHHVKGCNTAAYLWRDVIASFVSKSWSTNDDSWRVQKVKRVATSRPHLLARTWGWIGDDALDRFPKRLIGDS